MNETERLLAQANKDCPDCGGTGIIEGEMHPVMGDEHMTDAWHRDADRVCHCVPIMIIHALDVCQHGVDLSKTCEECGRWGRS
jgi:hypothetical protein